MVLSRFAVNRDLARRMSWLFDRVSTQWTQGRSTNGSVGATCRARSRSTEHFSQVHSFDS